MNDRTTKVLKNQSPEMSENIPTSSQNINKPKKSFLSRYWWVSLILNLILIVVIIILAVSRNCHDYQEITDNCGQVNQEYDDRKSQEEVGVMTSEQTQKAEFALAAGITIEDAENDYYQLSGPPIRDEDGRFDNYNPYPLPYTDLKSVSVGADSEYVYFKFRFYGRFPEKIPSYNGDEIEGIQGKIEDFVSATSGKEPYELHDSVLYAWYIDGKLEKIKPQLDHSAFISTDTLMRGHTRKGLVGGGMGYDYILAAYPLSLFNARLGDEVTFRATSETSSATYHHECIDGAGTEFHKVGITVKYKLGSDTYDVLEKPSIEKIKNVPGS